MFTVGDFYLHISPDPHYSFIGMLSQQDVGGHFDYPRHIILAEGREEPRTSSILFSNAPIEDQEKLLNYLKEIRDSGSTQDFPKDDFFVSIKKRNGYAFLMPTLRYTNPTQSTPIKTLKELQRELERFFPMPEYQYASIIRMFNTIHPQFESTQPPNLSL